MRCIAKRRSSRGWAGSRGRTGEGRPDAREAAVFRFDEGLKVYLYREPVDFRIGINGLSILVEQSMRLNPMASALFVFGNRRRDRIKILGWGGNGFWLLLKRLEADRFTWPSGTETISLTVEQLHWLLDGIDLALIQKHPRRFYERIG
ncbi:IS66 family insertion sequence element accessory protein TnpB [Paraburkholderia bannensis]